MKTRVILVAVFIVIVAAIVLQLKSNHGLGGFGGQSSGPADLVILSGSENKTLEPIIQQFDAAHHVNIQLKYQGSVDTMLQLQGGAPDADAVWPANSIWISLGDKHNIVKNAKSIMWSPVALGVKTSVAQRLGWIGRKVSVNDILAAAQAGKMRFMMTSATQSNSGACGFFEFLYAAAGKPQVLTEANLNDTAVQDRLRKILLSVDRSAGSSGWLKDLFVSKFSQYDAMVNYESVIIDMNREAAPGTEPLYAVYPSDGVAIADSPLGFIDKGDANKKKLFDDLQDYLLSAPVQQQILDLGRRVGPVGVDLKTASSAVFNPQWGISTHTFFNQIRFPSPDVIRDALTMYQTSLRKPSYTVYCLDFSGSMQGDREQKLKSALKGVLDQSMARESMLQASAHDITHIIIFSDHTLAEWEATGNNPSSLENLWEKVNAYEPGGGTDIYTPVMDGLKLIKDHADGGNYFPAVILMTDGESNTGANMGDLQNEKETLKLERDVPVFAIKFGDASSDQLDELANTNSGRVFDGTSDLTTAFRDVKGYN